MSVRNRTWVPATTTRCSRPLSYRHGDEGCVWLLMLSPSCRADRNYRVKGAGRRQSAKASIPHQHRVNEHRTMSNQRDTASFLPRPTHTLFGCQTARDRSRTCKWPVFFCRCYSRLVPLSGSVYHFRHPRVRAGIACVSTAEEPTQTSSPGL